MQNTAEEAKKYCIGEVAFYRYRLEFTNDLSSPLVLLHYTFSPSLNAEIVKVINPCSYGL